MKEKMVIWGASGHARVVAEIVRLNGKYGIYGFLDDLNPRRHNTTFCGSRILGGREQLDQIQKSGIRHLILGFGDCQARLKLSEFVREEKGFDLVTAIHPNATVASDAQVGVGTVIAAGAVASSASRIGENVIINTCASIDHECEIQDGVHISPGAHLGGRVVVGRGTWIGIGATVKDEVRIGENSLVGAGAAVLEDLPPNVVAYGSPARVIKTNE
jgi:acetyltransferase EpsM